MKLLDQSIDRYELQAISEFGTGKIFSSENKQIGTIKRKRFSIQSEIRIQDSDGVSLCTITKKGIDVKPLYYINSVEGVHIGTVKSKASKLRNALDWYDAEGRHVLAIHSDIGRRKFLITEPANKHKIYAEIIIPSSLRIFPPIGFISKNKYIMRIIDSDVPRLSLLVSTIIIMADYSNTEII